MFAKIAADKIVQDFLIKKADEDGLEPDQDSAEKKKKYWLTLAALGGGAALAGGLIWGANKYKEPIGKLVAGEDAKDERSLAKRVQDDVVPFGAAGALAGAAPVALARVRPLMRTAKEMQASGPGKWVADKINPRINASIVNAADWVLSRGLGLNDTPERAEGLAKNLAAQKARSWYDVISPRAGAPTAEAIASRHVVPSGSTYLNELSAALEQRSKNVPITAQSGADAKILSLQSLKSIAPSPGVTTRLGVPEPVAIVDRLKGELQAAAEGRISPANKGNLDRLLTIEEAKPAVMKNGKVVTPVVPAKIIQPSQLHNILDTHTRGGAGRAAAGRAGALSLLIPAAASLLGSLYVEGLTTNEYSKVNYN